ncbi:MAG: hypothetical protein AAF996_09010 [Pseudomonadota bacterium]
MVLLFLCAASDPKARRNQCDLKDNPNRSRTYSFYDWVISKQVPDMNRHIGRT